MASRVGRSGAVANAASHDAIDVEVEMAVVVDIGEGAGIVTGVGGDPPRGRCVFKATSIVPIRKVCAFDYSVQTA